MSCFFGLAGMIVGVAVSVWLELHEYRQAAAAGKDGQFDPHGYTLLFLLLPRAIIVGATIGGGVGLLVLVITHQIRGRTSQPL